MKKIKNKECEFWLNDKGEFHRDDDLPAFTYTSDLRKGDKFWYKNGVFHRLAGPAVEYTNDKINIWYINGKHIPVNSQEEFERYLKLMAFI